MAPLLLLQIFTYFLKDNKISFTQHFTGSFPSADYQHGTFAVFVFLNSNSYLYSHT